MNQIDRVRPDLQLISQNACGVHIGFARKIPHPISIKNFAREQPEVIASHPYQGSN